MSTPGRAGLRLRAPYRPYDNHVGTLATALVALDSRITTIVDNSHNTRTPEHSSAAGDGRVERGTETNKVTVRELIGAERDRIYAEQARRYPGFAQYARQTADVRTVPVLELRRA